MRMEWWTRDELVTYVTAQVDQGTSRKQIPARVRNLRQRKCAWPDTKKPASEADALPDVVGRAKWTSRCTSRAPQKGPPPLPPQATETLERYRAAIAAGQILPDQPGGAFDLLRDFKNQVGTDPTGQYTTR
jgi:hypothetical protein